MSVYPFAIKKCSKCNLDKSICEFGKCGKSKWGIKSACKECLRAAARQYACKKRAAMSKKDRVEHALKCKEWRQKKLLENPSFWMDEYYKHHDRNLKNASNHYYRYHEQKIDKMRKWRQENPDKMKMAVRSWRQKNPHLLKEGHKRWMKKNADHVREYNRKRRAMKRQATIQQFDIDQLNQRMSIFGYRCVYCGGPFEHVDHVIPLSRGGAHCLANLRPACAACNLSKHAKKLTDWLSEVA